jgi:glucan phosphorylase
MEDIIEQERDTLNYPAWGYALRYRYGIFRQEIVDGYQMEVPDYWLDFNPWYVVLLPASQ